MTFRPRVTTALVLGATLLGVVVAASPRAGGAAAKKPAATWISAPGRTPTVILPRPAGEPVGAMWDSLTSLEVAARWTVLDSVAGALVTQLEADPKVDSLALARALAHYANARIMRRQFSDGRAFPLLARAMNIRARRTPPTDPILIWGHTKAATFYSEAGSPDSARAHGELAIARLEAMAPTDTSMLAQAHLSLATALIALDRDAEARPHFESAIRYRERADGGESGLMVPMLAEYGGYLSRAGELDRVMVFPPTTADDFITHLAMSLAPPRPH
jgi:hypothetical protein